jgi:sorbitol-specific phosphotransferase system component IIC
MICSNKNQMSREQPSVVTLVTSAYMAIAGQSRGLLLAFPLAEETVSRYTQLYVTSKDLIVHSAAYNATNMLQEKYNTVHRFVYCYC